MNLGELTETETKGEQKKNKIKKKRNCCDQKNEKRNVLQKLRKLNKMQLQVVVNKATTIPETKANDNERSRKKSGSWLGRLPFPDYLNKEKQNTEKKWKKRGKKQGKKNCVLHFLADDVHYQPLHYIFFGFLFSFFFSLNVKSVQWKKRGQ